MAEEDHSDGPHWHRLPARVAPLPPQAQPEHITLVSPFQPPSISLVSDPALWPGAIEGTAPHTEQRRGGHSTAGGSLDVQTHAVDWPVPRTDQGQDTHSMTRGKVLKEALTVARKKNPVWLLPSPPRDASR